MRRARRSLGDTAFTVINTTIMVFVMFVTLYPFWYAIVGSFNAGLDYMRGGVNLWPREFSLANYRAVFRAQNLLSAYRVSVLRTVIATVVYLVVNATFAYPFSRKDLVLRKTYAGMGLVSMFFKAGVIPLYFVLRSLRLINTFWVLVIPTAFSFWAVIIFSSFFRELPDSLHESARIDGANEFTIFWRLVVPLSKPVIATLALFTAVYNWNDFRMSLIFTTRPELRVIQLVLLSIVNSAESAARMAAEGASDMVQQMQQDNVITLTVQLAAMVLTAVPILVIYPFLQRYFVKGLLIGSIKG